MVEVRVCRRHSGGSVPTPKEEDIQASNEAAGEEFRENQCGERREE